MGLPVDHRLYIVGDSMQGMVELVACGTWGIYAMLAGF
jgi:hypothetical protein